MFGKWYHSFSRISGQLVPQFSDALEVGVPLATLGENLLDFRERVFGWGWFRGGFLNGGSDDDTGALSHGAEGDLVGRQAFQRIIHHVHGGEFLRRVKAVFPRDTIPRPYLFL